MDISIRRLSSAIGAEVAGVNFKRPQEAGTVDRLQRALAEHCVLLFRDADITPERHIAFSRQFGPLEAHLLAEFSLPGHPEIFVVSNVKEDGKLKGAVYAGQFWHSDLSYMKKPSLGSLLLCLEMPDVGGDTMWANMYLAYDTLSEPMKAFIGGLKAVHDYSRAYDTYFSKLAVVPPGRKAKHPTHRPVIVHAFRSNNLPSSWFASRQVAALTLIQPRPAPERVVRW
jgi:taurine dioxygenase